MGMAFMFTGFWSSCLILFYSFGVFFFQEPHCETLCGSVQPSQLAARSFSKNFIVKFFVEAILTSRFGFASWQLGWLLKCQWLKPLE